MTTIPFCGQTYQDKTLNANAQDSINLYPMRTKIAQYSDKKISQSLPENIIMYPSPGYKWAQTVASYAGSVAKPIRALFTINSTLYIIVGNALIQFVPLGGFADLINGTFTSLGTLNTSTGNCSVICNTIQLAISDGQFGYTYNLTTGVFAVIASSGGFPASGGVTNFTYFDGYTIAAINNSKTVIQSNVLDASTFGPLAFDTITSFADNIVAVFSDELQLYIFGPKITEVQGDAGTIPYAFQKVSGVLIQAGCAAATSICKVGNTVIFLAADIAGKAYVAAFDGYATKVLSTPPINEAFERYTIISDAFAYSYREGDNLFYVITFPSANATWAYDVKMDMWHKRSINGGADLPSCCQQWQGIQVVGDASGNLYIMSQNYAYYSTYNSITKTVTDTPLTRTRTTAHVNLEGKTLFFNELWIDLQTGTGFISDSNLKPQPTISYPAIVQQNSNFSSPNVSVGLSATTAGNLLLVYAAITGANGIVTSVTDNLSQTYIQASGAKAKDTIGGMAGDIWYCPNTKAGVTSVTISISGETGGTTGEVTELSGLNGPDVLDAVAQISNASSSNLIASSAPITTTQKGDFLFVGTTIDNSNISSVSLPYILDSTPFGPISATFLNQGYGAGQTASFTLNNDSTYCASSIALKAKPQPSPEATLQVSKDFGRSWITVGIRSLGNIGQYNKRLIWRNIGRFKQNATFRLIITDAVQTFILGAKAIIKVGTK